MHKTGSDEQSTQEVVDADLARKSSKHYKDIRPSEEEHLTAYDKELADSFPASDPPSQP